MTDPSPPDHTMLPSGTVTFLFTDVEGSTRLWEARAKPMEEAQQLHDEIVSRAVTEGGGEVVKFLGDGTMAVFGDASDAVVAGARAQRSLQAAEWPASLPIRVRIGIHTTSAIEAEGDYHGSGVNRAARIAEAAHGGQVILSAATQAVAAVPEDLHLLYLGEHRLRDLGRPIGIYQLVGEGLDSDFPPIRSLDALDHNLPLQRTGFVGRATEMAAIGAALRTTRLVTLVGIGGVGKTRLAVQSAADLVDEFPDGIRLVQLAAVTDPDDVPGVVLEAIVGDRLDRAEREDPLTALVRHVGRRRMLLILDNAEHLRDRCAELTNALLDGAPNAAILVTSREPVGVPGEHTKRVEPLSVGAGPHAEPSEAMKLFVDRATAIKADFTLDDSNRDAVHSICRFVDGIPLAIELAAARVAHLSPAEIADRLEDQMGELLQNRGAATPERHRTIESMLDWSHDLLEPEEQVLFRRMAVFAGSASLPAIEAICSLDDLPARSIFSLLASLTDKSLVVADQTDRGNRYHQLETVHRYARRRLEEAGEVERIRLEHARWYAGLLEEASDEHGFQDGLDSLLHTELDEVLAALHFAAAEDEIDLACRIGAVAWRRWEMTGRLADGRRLLSELLEHSATPSSQAYGGVLNGAASLALAAGDLRAAWDLQQVNLTHHRELGDRAGTARVENSLALIALFDGRHDEAEALIERSLIGFDEVADEAGRAYALTTRAMLERARGASEDATNTFLTALAVLRRLGRKRDAASVLNNLGNLAHDAGDLMRAHRFHEGALNLHQELADDRGAALSLNNLSIVASERGDPERASDFANEALELFEKIDDTHGVAAMLNNLANLAEEQGDPRSAIDLYGKAIEQFRDNGDAWGMATALENLADIALRTDNAQLGWKALLDAASIHLGYRRWGPAALDLTRASGLASGLDLHRDALTMIGAAEALLTREHPDYRTSEEVIEAMRGPLTGAEVTAALEAGRVADAENLVTQLRMVPLPEVEAVSEPDHPASLLTRREREVASFVGRGYSNREIAEQLFISERTVDSHITHIRNKLGITSRTQLAVWAVKHLHHS